MTAPPSPRTIKATSVCTCAAFIALVGGFGMTASPPSPLRALVLSLLLSSGHAGELLNLLFYYSFYSPHVSDLSLELLVRVLPSRCLSSLTAGRSLRRIQEHVRGVQLQDAKQLLTHAGCGSFQHVTQGKIQQPLDHFNAQDPRTFPQVEEEAETLPQTQRGALTLLSSDVISVFISVKLLFL